MIPEGWTAHDGGERPPDWSANYRIRRRDGTEEVRKGIAVYWVHTGSPRDIIAYQEVKQ